MLNCHQLPRPAPPRNSIKKDDYKKYEINDSVKQDKEIVRDDFDGIAEWIWKIRSKLKI